GAFFGVCARENRRCRALRNAHFAEGFELSSQLGAELRETRMRSPGKCFFRSLSMIATVAPRACRQSEVAGSIRLDLERETAPPAGQVADGRVSVFTSSAKRPSSTGRVPPPTGRVFPSTGRASPRGGGCSPRRTSCP